MPGLDVVDYRDATCSSRLVGFFAFVPGSQFVAPTANLRSSRLAVPGSWVIEHVPALR